MLKHVITFTNMLWLSQTVQQQNSFQHHKNDYTFFHINNQNKKNWLKLVEN